LKCYRIIPSADLRCKLFSEVLGMADKTLPFFSLSTSLITINYLSYFLHLDTNKKTKTNKNTQTHSMRRDQDALFPFSADCQ
jgi:hypothetical protein